MANCRSMLRHQKADPSNENESHLWKKKKKNQVRNGTLVLRKFHINLSYVGLCPFFRLFLLEHLVKAEGAHPDNAGPRKDHKDQATSRKFHG